MFGRTLRVFELLLFFEFCLYVSRIPAQTTQKTQTDFQPIFKQEEFIRNDKSKEILKYLNQSADPCEDFYAYSCGNWQRNDFTSSQQILEDKVERDLKVLLKEDVTVNDGFNGRKIKDFYKSCLNALPNGQQQQQFYSELIRLNGGFPAVPGSNWNVYHPNYDWQETVANLRYHYNMDILIGIRIEPNANNLHEDTIYLTTPSTVLPKHLCNTEIDRKINDHRSEYEKIENEVADNLKTWLSIESSEAKRVANRILLFEFELCRAVIENVSGIEDETAGEVNLTRRTLHEFTSHFNNSIDFYKYISRSYNVPFPRPVSMRTEPYYRNLIRTISIHEKSEIANYIMYRALSILSFPFNDSKQTRPSYCVRIIKCYFPQVLGAMYYRKFVNLGIKSDVEGIFDKLKFAFEYSLRSVWIEEGTSRVGLAKLKDIGLYMPEYDEKLNLNHLNINATHYWYNMAQVMSQPQVEELKRLFAIENVKPADEIEAYDVRLKYRSKYKRIEIGWALLQPPFFHQIYPYSMKFSIIGQKIAREMAKAFNDFGWSDDILNLANWDHITSLAYENRSECFREQISFYIKNKSDSFRNTTELRELIAISAGVNVAFAAYLNWLDYLNPNNDFNILRKETLTDLNLTNTQLFFVTYAQMNCHTEEIYKINSNSCPLHQHSLRRYSVNGPLSNSIEFGRDFGCLIGTGMSQADKCIVY